MSLFESSDTSVRYPNTAARTAQPSAGDVSTESAARAQPCRQKRHTAHPDSVILD